MRRAAEHRWATGRSPAVVHLQCMEHTVHTVVYYRVAEDRYRALVRSHPPLPHHRPPPLHRLIPRKRDHPHPSTTRSRTTLPTASYSTSPTLAPDQQRGNTDLSTPAHAPESGRTPHVLPRPAGCRPKYVQLRRAISITMAGGSCPAGRSSHGVMRWRVMGRVGRMELREALCVRVGPGEGCRCAL